MLNLGKLAFGQEEYYLEAVAQGTEDYYLHAGEADGYWLGGGAGVLGLAGSVDGDDLRNVLRGQSPDSGENLLMRRMKDRVPGWDATFRAPKSVSLLYALGTPEASDAVRLAHDASVAAAVDFLERHASTVRRGYGGGESLTSSGFVGAAFRHRTSRAGDPLLHTHVLLANMLEGADGRWSSIDGRLLYNLAKTTGYLYQANLRHHLTQELGVGWNQVHNGVADVEGVTRKVIMAFSRRREEIELRMEGRGETSAKAAQTAALSTRKKKDYDVTPETLADEWVERAAGLGFTPEVIAALLGRAVVAELTPVQVEQLELNLASPEGLTEQASTFQRRDTLRSFCDRLPTGAPVAEVEAMADAFLEGDRVLAALMPSVDPSETIKRADGTTVRATATARFTTPEMVATEERLLAAAIGRVEDGVGLVPPETVESVLAKRPILSAEQVRMVTELTNSGRGVDVVVGKAGAGKTTAADAAREAWQLTGYPVIGCALSARAAAELQSGAGITSYTLDSLLMDLDSPENPGLPRNAVVVVDEAAMVGTRKLDRLLAHAQQAQSKVVHRTHREPTPGRGVGTRGIGPAPRGGVGSRIVPLPRARTPRPWRRCAGDPRCHGVGLVGQPASRRLLAHGGDAPERRR